MDSIKTITIDPVYIEIGIPALAIGLALGALFAWLIARSRRRHLEDSVASLEMRIKDQDALQVEREAAFEQATTRLATAFSDLTNQSLKSNSENFLRLAEQNLSRLPGFTSFRSDYFTFFPEGRIWPD